MKHSPAVYVDMNDYFAHHRPMRESKSIYLEPALTQTFLNALHRTQGVAYSFGGYLENREDLWAGSYMEPEKSVHLGIDINVPAGTEVSVVHPCRVAKIIHDSDQDGGWGSVIMFALEKPVGRTSHFIYAHLSKDDIRVKAGDIIEPGQIVASLGTPDVNGGWYEHLHVQAMTMDAWNMVRDRHDMGAFDGYDSLPYGRHKLSPDPAFLLG